MNAALGLDAYMLVSSIIQIHYLYNAFHSKLGWDVCSLLLYHQSKSKIIRRLNGQRTDFYLLIIKSFFPVWPEIDYLMDTSVLEDLPPAVVSVDFTVKITKQSVNVKVRSSLPYVMCCWHTWEDFMSYDPTGWARGVKIDS